MFDIQEYYQGNYRPDPESSFSINDIDDDISDDIDELLKNRFDKLYLQDRYKHGSHNIDIIYPRLGYPGNRSLMLGPDKVRFLLSLYPGKEDLQHIQKIVIRPRYIEIGSIELTSLYIAQKKVLVIYLFHPYVYPVTAESGGSFTGMSLEDLAKQRFSRNLKQRENAAHPLWYYISVIARSRADNNRGIEKFFIKKNPINDSEYRILNDISCYFSQHGY